MNNEKFYQSQLTEAVGLMQETERVLRVGDGYGWEDRLANNLTTFLARHAQAEQQGAKAEPANFGQELDAFEKWRHTQADSLRRCGYSDGADAFIRLGSVQWAGWQARAALATRPAVPVAEHPVVKALLEVAAAAHLALEGTDSDGVDSTWDEADRASLEAAIEVLDRLPDDQPGFTMEPAAKAAWALRNLNAVRGAEHE